MINKTIDELLKDFEEYERLAGNGPQSYKFVKTLLYRAYIAGQLAEIKKKP